MSYTAITHTQRIGFCLIFVAILWIVAIITALITANNPLEFKSLMDYVSVIALISALLASLFFAILVLYNDWGN